MKKIVTGLALTLVLASSALAAPKSGCCADPKKPACCKAACCDAAKGKTPKPAHATKKAKAPKAALCCGMPCCDGGACCG